MNEPVYGFFEKDNKYYYKSVKCKGRFEFHNLPLHKNKKHLVVRKALHQYFVYNHDPMRYIEENKNIMDYVSAIRVYEPWKLVTRKVNSNMELIDIEQQKTVRYFVSNRGVKIIKINKDDNREIQTEAGFWQQSILNIYNREKPFEQYNVCLRYYKGLVEKEIEKIQTKPQDIKQVLDF